MAENSLYQTALGRGLLGGTLGSSFGSGLSSLFGGNKYGEGVDRAMQLYEQEMRRARGELTGREEQGQKDIREALESSQMYGEPYREAGTSALQSYLGSLGLGGSQAQQLARQSFQTSPGYQFALQEGLKSLRNQLSGTGLRGSGAEQKELMRYGQNLAQQEYGRWQDRLQQLTGMGGTASEQAAQRQFQTGGLLSQLGYGYGGLLSNLSQQMGLARAEAELEKAREEAERKKSTFGSVGGLLGAGAGFLLGGPAGASLGGTLGGTIDR